MKFTLNIYKKKQIEKTYKTDAYDLMFGTLEDFLDIIDLEKLSGGGSDIDFIGAVANVVTQGVSQLKPLLFDVFDGLTEEELKRTKAKDVINVIIQIAMYSFTEIKGISNQKNV